MVHTARRPVLLALLLAIAPVAGEAQTSSAGDPRPLEIADYALWRSISGRAISPDGEWVAWSYGRIRGDDTLHIRTVDGTTDHEVAFATAPLFSDDGRWVAYEIGLSFAESQEDEDGRVQAGLLSLETGDRFTWDNADDFGFAPGSSHFWVKKVATDEEAEHDGTDVLVRDLRTGSTELLGSVDELDFDAEGDWLAYTVDAADQAGNGLYLMATADGRRRALDQASARYEGLTWADEQAAVAVLRGTTPDDFEERENTLVVATDLTAPAPAVRTVDAEDGLDEGWVLSEKGALSFNEDADMVFVGVRPQSATLEEWPDSALPLADVNVWHWADERIQSQQQRAASRDRNRTWRAAVHLAEPEIVQLGRGRTTTAGVTPDGRWAITRDDSDYVSDWMPSYADWSRVDTRTGERVPVAEGLEQAFGISPRGDHWLYWREGQFHAYDIAGDRHVALTASSPVSFVNAEYNYPGEHPPYGLGGFTADGDAVLVYDKHDVWRQPFDGSPAENLTGGWGAENDVRLRLEVLDPDAEEIDLDEPVMLRGFGLRTKQDGFFRLDGDALDPLVFDDARFGRPLKAADADRILTTREDWRTFPDLWVADGGFEGWTRITEANPQQGEFLWGDRILFDYETTDGIPLQGTLAIPDTWEPGQRLPMIVRFYEQYSQDLHAYPTPAYRHQPNFAGYVSRGYLLMQPDIHFRTRTTHSDMLEAVEAATQAVIDLGYADPEAIGLSGHSFSGGGGAYIATRSNMFAAVAHGAAPINLVSEFNQLFVGSGQNNHSYDIYGQGRYGTNPYDDFDLYWDQSPISGVEQMDTPVLYLHGEADPTVNWEQGLEWYNALRFNDKPVIWLSYPDEGHGLSKLENRIDFQMRLQQFFGHHLRGEPAPGWMTEGVPFLEKPRHMRRFAPGPIGWGGSAGGR